MQNIKDLVDILVKEHGNVVRRKTIIDAAIKHGYNTTLVWKQLCQPSMRAEVRGQFDLSKWNGHTNTVQIAAAPKPKGGTLEAAFDDSEVEEVETAVAEPIAAEPPPMRVYDLKDRPMPYPNIYFWDSNTYILVKDGVHYPVKRDKMDIMVKESRGHHEEIVKHYVPRVRKARKPRTAKQDENVTVVNRSGKSSISSEWIEPSMVHPSQKSKYTAEGFRI